MNRAEYITAAEWAHARGYHRDTVRSIIARGVLPAVKVPRHHGDKVGMWMIHKDDLQRPIECAQRPPMPESAKRRISEKAKARRAANPHRNTF